MKALYSRPLRGRAPLAGTEPSATRHAFPANLKKISVFVLTFFPRHAIIHFVPSNAGYAKHPLGRMAQLVEHIVHIDGVTGSSPVATTNPGLSLERGNLFFFVHIDGGLSAPPPVAVSGSLKRFESCCDHQFRVVSRKRQPFLFRSHRWRFERAAACGGFRLAQTVRVLL